MTQLIDNYCGPGLYKHYKGGLYWVVGVGVHESTKDDLGDQFDPNDQVQQWVIYWPITSGSLLDDSETNFWIRSRVLDINSNEPFDGIVELENGVKVRRFEKVERIVTNVFAFDDGEVKLSFSDGEEETICPPREITVPRFWRIRSVRKVFASLLS